MSEIASQNLSAADLVASVPGSIRETVKNIKPLFDGVICGFSIYVFSTEDGLFAPSQVVPEEYFVLVVGELVH